MKNLEGCCQVIADTQGPKSDWSSDLPPRFVQPHAGGALQLHIAIVLESCIRKSRLSEVVEFSTELLHWLKAMGSIKSAIAFSSSNAGMIRMTFSAQVWYSLAAWGQFFQLVYTFSAMARTFPNLCRPFIIWIPTPPRVPRNLYAQKSIHVRSESHQILSSESIATLQTPRSALSGGRRWKSVVWSCLETRQTSF